MKREVGASAGILALIAVVMHTQFPSPREAPPEPSKAEQAKRERKQAQPEQNERREGPWVATRAFFQAGEAPPALPAPNGIVSPCGRADIDVSLTCIIEPEHKWDAEHTGELRTFLGMAPRDRNRYRTWSIVATMADPSHTRLPLFLDRQVEAVVRSLQAQDFELAGQWMPWADRFDSSEPDISERLRQRKLQREQEQMPGVLIFRRFHHPVQLAKDGSPIREVLFVFVVPEMPTNGISGPPFFAAMRLAFALTEQSRMGYLAPSFSGSFESLAALINRWNRAAGPTEKIKGTFYGGTVSSRTASDKFLERTKVEFRSGIASSLDSDAALCHVLTQYGLKEADVAYLKEDETAFSTHDSDIQTGCQPIISYVFPRDISHLRNVYQQEAEPGSANPRRAPAPGVSFSLKDPNSGEDSVPTFSDIQTPLSQDSVVHSIMDELRRRRTLLVYIVATNVLDALFLAQVVREESPDTRVLTEYPDVLFVAATSQTPLNGTLFLSTYPMSFEVDNWLSHDEKERARRLLFPSQEYQGLYNVTQSVLADIQAVNSRTEAASHQRGYAQIENNRQHPGVWLLTLQHSGFLPIDSIDDWHDKGNSDLAAKHTERIGRVNETEPATAVKEKAPVFPSPPRSWFITTTLITAFAYWGCFLLVRANHGLKLRWPVWLTLRDSQVTLTPRALAMLSTLLALSVIEWILFLPIWLSSFEGGRPGFGAMDYIGAAGWLAPLLIAAYLWLQEDPPVGLGAAGYLAAMLGLFGFVTWTWLWCCALQGTPAAVLFRYRAIELYSGSSPALPLFLLGITTLMGSLFYLRRFSRAGQARPRLELASFNSLRGPLMRCYEGIDGQIGAAGPTGRREWLERAGYALAPVMIAVLLLRAWRYAAAFERPLYNFALVAAVSVLLSCLTVACYDLIRIWKYLDRMLGLIDLLPLRSAFRRVARDWPKRPIWASSQRLSKPFMARQMLSALHNRRILLETRDAEKDVREFWARIPSRFDAKNAAVTTAQPAALASTNGDLAAALPASAEDPHRETTVEQFLEGRHAYEDLCAKLLDRIVTSDLAPLWTRNVNEDVQPAKESADNPAERLRMYCSDFVALQLARYFIYVVSQAQSIAWCLSFSLLMLMLVLNSYSPQAPLLLSQFLAAIFIAIGVVVFWVFAGMERNAILSRIARTQPGQLNQEFWLQLVGLGILPLIGVLSHLFPSLSNFLSSWMAPGTESMH